MKQHKYLLYLGASIYLVPLLVVLFLVYQVPAVLNRWPAHLLLRSNPDLFREVLAENPISNPWVLLIIFVVFMAFWGGAGWSLFIKGNPVFPSPNSTYSPRRVILVTCLVGLLAYSFILAVWVLKPISDLDPALTSYLVGPIAFLSIIGSALYVFGLWMTRTQYLEPLIEIENSLVQTLLSSVNRLLQFSRDHETQEVLRQVIQYLEELLQTYDDAAGTLTEILNQLESHVELPESFRYQWRVAIGIFDAIQVAQVIKDNEEPKHNRVLDSFSSHIIAVIKGQRFIDNVNKALSEHLDAELNSSLAIVGDAQDLSEEQKRVLYIEFLNTEVPQIA